MDAKVQSKLYGKHNYETPLLNIIVEIDARKEFLLISNEALLNCYDEVSVKPEINKLYLEVTGTIFKSE